MKNMSKDDEIDTNIDESIGSGSDPSLNVNDDTITDDMVWDETDDELSDSGNAAKIKKLRQQLSEMQKQRDEYLADLQRERADSINFRKSEDEKRKNLRSTIEGNVIENIFPILDSFESAMKNTELWQSVDKNWRIGIEYIHSQIIKLLDDYGVSIIQPTGMIYDATTMEAHEYRTSDAHPAETVIETLMSGYRRGEYIMRPAKVVVAAEHDKTN